MKIIKTIIFQFLVLLKKSKDLDATWYIPSTGRSGFKEYLQERIPSAQFFDIDKISDTSSSLPHMLPSTEQFEKQVSELGIENDKHVLIYDANGVSGPRVYQMFHIFGHQKVSLLDGGFNKWKSEYPNIIEKGEPQKAKMGNFKATFNQKLIKNLKDILKNIETEEFCVVDARSQGRFNGTEPEPRPNLPSGHIPKSHNVFFQTIYNKDGTFKSNQELEQLFKDSKVNLDQNIICTCGSGVTACVLWTALEILEKKNVTLYDGAWTEYASNHSNEILTKK